MPEFLQQPSQFIAGRHRLAGKYASVSAGGTQAFWDGGISRGRATIDIPYSNTAGNIVPIATGLWTANGQVIESPDWFLNQMPPYMLVGSLSATKEILKARNARAWKSVEYHVYDAPPVEAIFSTRSLSKPRFKRRIDLQTVRKWMKTLPAWVRKDFRAVPFGTSFGDTLLWLREHIEVEGRITLHTHWLLPNDELEAHAAAAKLVERYGSLIIRDPEACYSPRRVGTVLKYPPILSSEAMVTGFVSGSMQNLGLIEALRCEIDGKAFRVEGLKGHIREFADEYMADWAWKNPGAECPIHFEGKYLRPGQVVSFNYSEIKNGIPLGASLTKSAEMV